MKDVGEVNNITYITNLFLRCPATGRGGPWGSGRLRLWIFSTFGTMKVIRSSPLRTGRLYPQEFRGTHF
jgi:hypothetical protein